MSVHFDDLSPGRCQCRFPLWKGAARTGLVCAEPVKPGSSYCACHHARVYEPPTVRRLERLERTANVKGAAKIDCSVHPEFEEAK